MIKAIALALTLFIGTQSFAKTHSRMVKVPAKHLHSAKTKKSVHAGTHNRKIASVKKHKVSKKKKSAKKGKKRH